MNLWQDVQFSLRSMRKSPRVTLTVLATLALGIGANTAIFSVVKAALLEPLPFRDPGELVQLNADLRALGAQNVGFSELEFEDLRDRAGVFSAVSVIWQCPVNLTGGDHPERLEFLAVSPNYFEILGSHPEVGRLFDQRDIRDGFAESVVISDDLWHKEFGGDSTVIGRRIRLDNDLYTIVGVTPPEFRHPAPAGSNPIDLWATSGFRALPFPKPQRNIRFLPGIIGRLKPGMNMQQARAQLAILSDSLRKDYGSDYPMTAGWTLTATELKDVVASKARTLLISLLLAVGLILLIACVNVANLMLANASARQGEIAIRLALGATRGRIVSQLMTESALLSLISALAGVVAASIGLRLLVATLPSQLPRLNPISVDGRVLMFSLGMAVVTTIIFGLIPASQAAQTQPRVSDLHQRGRSSSRSGVKLGKILIGSEVALSLMLLVAAGLLLRTFWNLLQVQPGFDTSHLLAGSVWIPVPNDPTTDLYAKPEQRTAFLREVSRRLRGVPGIESAALSSAIPLHGDLLPSGYRVEGAPDQGDAPTAVQVAVTPEFFRTMGTPVLRGRVIAETDVAGSPRVVLVDQAAARHFWGDRDPVGRRIRFSRDFNVNGKVQQAPWMIVVGVVGDVKFSSLDEHDVPHVYNSLYQFAGRDFGVLVRGTGDKDALTRAVTREIQSVDPNLPVSRMSQMTELMSTGVGDRRFAAWLIGAFAMVALALTSVGVYGVASYAIVRRQKEIGIRSALGANPAQLVRMILREGMMPVLAGLGIGCILAALSGRLLRKLLFDVSSADVLVFLCAGVALVAVGVLANWLPARRASLIDPILALRND